MRKMSMTRFVRFVFLTGALQLALVISAHARESQWVLSIYGGTAWTTDADVTLKQGNETDLRFSDVTWRSRSFESPIYYGYRISYWPQETSRWGVTVDFTHAKMHSELDETVNVSGKRSGAAVNTREPLSNTFDALEFSHGHNLLTLNATHRWFPRGRRDDSLIGRIQPYAGVGAGIAIPHVEVQVSDSWTSNYQIGGPAIQGLVGANLEIIGGLALFADYKLTYADIEADLSEGGTLKVRPFTQHFALGLSYGF